MGGRHRTDELEGGYGPYHEPSGRRRASRGKVLVPLAGAVALAVLLGVAAYVIMSRDTACGDGGAGTVALKDVAAPDIEPALQQIASGFAKDTSANASCAAVSVSSDDPASVAGVLAGSGAMAGQADLWIPDSSLWVAKVRSSAKGSGLSAPIGSAARSPVVLAAPKPAVEKLKSAFGEPSWSGLMSAANAATPDGIGRKVRILPLDPNLNAAGLGALLAGSGVLQATGAGEEQLVGVLRQLSENAVNTPAAMFTSMAKQSTRVPIGVASEQGVWAFNARTRPGSIVALYPAEGTISLDYPLVVTAKEGAARDAARRFAAALSGADAQKTIRSYGFRTPDGRGGSAISAANGLNPATPRDMKLPDKTEMGTWIFSTNLNGKGVDYREAVPIGPLGAKVGGATRREVISQALSTTKAKPTGDTGLNDTLAAAYDRFIYD